MAARRTTRDERVEASQPTVSLPCRPGGAQLDLQSGGMSAIRIPPQLAGAVDEGHCPARREWLAWARAPISGGELGSTDVWARRSARISRSPSYNAKSFYDTLMKKQKHVRRAVDP